MKKVNQENKQKLNLRDTDDIYPTKNSLEIAAKRNPDRYKRFLEFDKKVSHSTCTLAETIAEVAPDQPPVRRMS